MLVIGLTGSIGMGKSAVADMFRNAGVGVCDADQEVHNLYDGAAVAPIEEAFPGTTSAGKVDRAKLSAALLANPRGFKILEEIVHPLVHATERAFLLAEAARGAKMAVLESPLLFEVDTANRVDVIVVVSASPENQRQRVLQRPGMTPAKFEALLARQLIDAEKRRRADTIVDTNGSLEDTNARVVALIRELSVVDGQAFEREWAEQV
jgi:dephospho-CoA kinase